MISIGAPRSATSWTACATAIRQLSMPATATPASCSSCGSSVARLELGDEPDDLTGGDAGADREAADLVDDGGGVAV